MPILKEWEVGECGFAAIWKIEEPESFFIEKLGLATDQIPAISNEKRRIEHLAGRFLLQHLNATLPLHLITKDEHGKPQLPDGEGFFSISHSYPYVAAVVDEENEAGIDIQTWHPAIEQIQHKYLSADEQEMVGIDPKMIPLAWCAKESAYKWHGKKGVEFIEELPILNFKDVPDYNINIYIKLNPIPQMIFLESIIHTDFACCYIQHLQNWVIY